jgi:LysM repeat protein
MRLREILQAIKEDAADRTSYGDYPALPVQSTQGDVRKAETDKPVPFTSIELPPGQAPFKSVYDAPPTPAKPEQTADPSAGPASWQDIYRINRDVVGRDPNLIKPGQQLKLPDGSTYIVRPGDSLSKIAARSDKPAADLPTTATPSGTMPPAVAPVKPIAPAPAKPPVVQRPPVGQPDIVTTASGIPLTTSSGVPVTTPGSPVTDLVTQKIAGRESGGSYTAINPLSGATGKYQFMPSTFAGLVKQARPGDPLYGKTWDDYKNDPATQEATMATANKYYDRVLGQNKIEVTPGRKYLAHFVGAERAANMIKADPDTDLKKYYPDKLDTKTGTMRPHPFWTQNPNMDKEGIRTVGDLQRWTDNKMAAPVQTADPKKQRRQ